MISIQETPPSTAQQNKDHTKSPYKAVGATITNGVSF